MDAVAADFLQVTLNFGISHEDFPRKGLRLLFEREQYTDVTFVVEGSPVQAHKAIVASQSEYFDRLLYGPMKESTASKITLEETHLEAFRLLLMYMYTGSVGTLDMQSALELLGLADRYGFEELKKALQERFFEILDESNALQLLFCADAFNAKKLHRDCLKFIDSNAESILALDAVQSLPQESLIELISRDMFVAEEMHIFRAVQRWIEYNGKSKEISALLACVRLTEIPKHCLLDDVYPSGLFSMSSVFVATETQRMQKLSGMAPRGKIRGSNLFGDRCIVLESYRNFFVEELPPKKYDKVCSSLVFRLLHRASMEPSFITLRFRDVYLVNELQFRGFPETSGDFTTEEPFCYKIRASKDGSHWVTVVNYSTLKCYSLQQLYFPKLAVSAIYTNPST